MRDITTKADNVGDTLSAGDFNADQNELENVVTSADLTLDPAGGPDSDLKMLSKAVAGYANAGNIYTDSGSANNYVLALASNLEPPSKYYDNMLVFFKAGAANTGSSTINVNSLGAKSLTLTDGTALSANWIISGRYYTAVYNSASDRFELTDRLFAVNTGNTGTTEINSGTQNVAADFKSTDTTVSLRLFDDTSIATIQNSGGNLTLSADAGNTNVDSNLIFSIDNAEVGRFDTNGNFGIGVAPESDWSSTYSVLQVGVNTSLWGNANSLYLTKNAYYSTDWYYQDTDEASMYYQTGGGHEFYVAPSGTAGSVLTWTEALEVTNGADVNVPNGNLTIQSSTVRDWNTNFGAIDVGEECSVFANFSLGAVFAFNTWYDTTYTYKLTDHAALIELNGVGNIEFQGAPSGTGGTTFSPTTSARINTGSSNIGTGWNAGDTMMVLGEDTTTNRSLNAAGTLNASGADYAEYEKKADPLAEIAKGDIVGFDANGQLTTKFSEAKRFQVKSTDPAIVGGDSWCSTDVIGEEPKIKVPKIKKPDKPGDAPFPAYKEPKYSGPNEPRLHLPKYKEPEYAGPAEPRLQLPTEPDPEHEAKHAMWELLCEQITAQYENGLAAYQEAVTAHNAKVAEYVTWYESECQNLQADYDEALAIYDAAVSEYNRAVAEYKEWYQAECTKIQAEHDALVAKYEEDCLVHEQAIADAKAQYEIEKEAFGKKVEELRQHVDRIAYSGKVPVNIQATTADVGSYVVPVSGANDGITADIIPAADITFSEYRQAVGIIHAIQEDGRPVIAVKVG